MVEFLKISEQEVHILERYMLDLEKMRIKLADFFVEEVKSFKLEECFKILQNFREKFRQAVVDNERRRIQEQQANFRRKQREDQLAMKRRNCKTFITRFQDNSAITTSSFSSDAGPFPGTRQSNPRSESPDRKSGSTASSNRLIYEQQ